MILGAHVLLSGEQIPTPPPPPPERSETVVQKQERQERHHSDSNTSPSGNARSPNDRIDNDSIVVPVEATAYTAFCDTGCIGITATGVDVSNTIYHEGKNVIAVDPSIVPLNTPVKLTFEDGSTMKAVAADTGGAIKGNRIDILVRTREQALQFGRQNVKLTIGG